VRSVALKESRTTTLVFDNSLDHYLCDNVLLPDRPGQRFYIAVREDHDPSFDLTADFDSRSELSFDFEGVPNVKSTPMVSGTVILGCGKEQYQVAIAAGTGRTTVSRVGGKNLVSQPAETQP
jgi:hypothetical protein